MTATDLQWRTEQACFNAWPSRRVAVAGEWIARLTGGPSRRNDSANPLRPDARIDAATIAAVTAVYDAAGQTTLFRVPDFLGDVDAALDGAGFGPPVGETRTLLRPAAPLAVPRVPVHLERSAGAAWCAARACSSGGSHSAGDTAALLALHGVPAAFARIEQGGEVVAIAAAAVSQRLVVLESVQTDVAHRGRGLASACCTALIAWGMKQGADAACLQVQADNTAALSLYARLGFSQDLYRYHYRAR